MPKEKTLVDTIITIYDKLLTHEYPSFYTISGIVDSNIHQFIEELKQLKGDVGDKTQKEK